MALFCIVDIKSESAPLSDDLPDYAMHIAFLSNPASGQVNVQFATAQQLVDQGHLVTFLSAASCSSKIDRFRCAQQPCHQHLIRFISLGSGHTVRDFTAFIQTRMHLMRRVPGDPVSLETCIEAALGPADEHAATALRVRDHINEVDPDMSMPQPNPTRMAIAC